MQSAIPDFLNSLRTLVRHKVDFIIVGGVCASLHGAPVNTYDIDIVHSRSPKNIERLLAALQELDAVYRAQGGRILRPKGPDLASAGHHLLKTSAGPIDVLGTIAKERGYEDLLPHTTEFEIDPGVTVRVLNLDMLIQTKEELGREKDKLALPVLRRTLDEIRKSKSAQHRRRKE